MRETMTGGCQCGRMRYSVTVDDREAYLCHCRMCQRAVGGVSVALKLVEIADVDWSGAARDLYRSSPFAQRGFCAACGTSLTYEGDDHHQLDLTVGSLDEPQVFTPVSHSGVESRHDAWIDTRGLPEQRTDENARIAQKWIDSVGHLPA